MKATELRLGNFITRRGTVKDILTVDIDLLLKIQRQGFIFKPIPLTEEWLLKFGFIKRYEDCYEHGKFILNDKFIMMDIDITIKCLYVHQLQNLYFALTGKELSI